MSITSRQIANVLLALALFPASSFSSWSGMGRTVGEMSRAQGFAPEVPAGYAFAIWGLIFSLTLIYALRQALPSYRDHGLYQRIGWVTAMSSLLNSIWMVLAQTIGNGWWLVLIIFGILGFALTAFFGVLAEKDRLDRFDRFIVLPMTALLAAWLSAAVWLNTASWVKLMAPERLGLSLAQYALVVLSVAAVFSWAVLARARGNLIYAGTTIWALVGIVVANLSNGGGETLVALAAGILVPVTLALAAWARSRAKPGAIAEVQ